MEDYFPDDAQPCKKPEFSNSTGPIAGGGIYRAAVPSRNEFYEMSLSAEKRLKPNGSG
jgi:hypothetical protein